MTHHRPYHLAAERHRGSVAEMWNRHRNEPLLRRAGKVAVGEILYLTAFERFLSQFSGYNFIGSGTQSVVLAAEDGSHVMKVLINTSTSSESRVHDWSAAYQAASDVGKEFLQDQWLDTNFCPVPMRVLPFMAKGYAAVAVQEKVEPLVDLSKIDNLLDINLSPTLVFDLRRLISNIRKMHLTHGIYPDIRGGNNVVLLKGEDSELLRVVDTSLLPDNSNMRIMIPGLGVTMEEAITRKLDEIETDLDARSIVQLESREIVRR